MSGVQAASRVERLEALARRTKHELDSARRREDHHEVARLNELGSRVWAELAMYRPAVPEPTPEPEAVPEVSTVADASEQPPRVPRPKVDQLDLLAQLGITARDVKVWAVERGLLPEVRRGRVSTGLIEAYADAPG